MARPRGIRLLFAILAGTAVSVAGGLPILYFEKLRTHFHVWLLRWIFRIAWAPGVAFGSFAARAMAVRSAGAAARLVQASMWIVNILVWAALFYAVAMLVSALRRKRPEGKV
jgi:hypothetical protein